MSMTVTIGGTSFAYKPGMVFKEKLSEALDEGTLIIPHVTIQTFKPMDQVVITDGTWTKYALISHVNRKTTKYEAPKNYTYTLSLTSPTIQLQRIVLPNRSITQPLTGTKTDIYTVLSHYVSMYSSFDISSALQSLTTDVDCPEFQWNRPTLFEVFNDLLSEVDCVVTMTDFDTISYLDLNPSGSAISDDNLADVDLEQGIEDYANRIEAEAENAVVNQTNTRVIEWVAVKTDADAVLTTDNAKLILEKPVYRINSVKEMWIQTQSTFQGASADITDYVVHKKVYDTCDTSESASVVTGAKKRNRLYFEEGSNIIDGLCYTEATWLGITPKKAAINILINAYLDETSVDITASIANTDILDLVFQVDYQTQETTKIATRKTKTYTGQTTETPNTLINNQDTSYVDYKSFANKQQFTAYRLGNAMLTMTGKYDEVADIPALGDHYDTDYILAEREFSIEDDYIKFKGLLSKNYVLKDIFTGLKQQRRYTSLALENEALESHHIKEYYFNLARNADDEVSINSNTSDATLENYIFKLGEADEQIRMVHFKSDSNTDVGVSPSSYFTKNSISLTYKMYDNFAAGMQVDDTGTGKLMKYVPYVDSDGKFTSFVFALYKGYGYMDEDPQVTYPLHKIRALPELDTDLLDSADLVFTSGTLTRYKDNREITVETIQFNFTHDSNTIYGDKFFSDNPMTHVGSTDTSLYVAYSTSLTYSEGDQTAKGTIDDGTHLTYTKSNNDITISSPDSSITISELASWAICDADGNIYVAVNL